MGRSLGSNRTFVAVEIPAPVRAALEGEARAAAHRLDGLRAVPEANLHVTLRFLGDVPHDAVGSIASAIAGAVAEMSPFTFRLRGMGVFPGPGRARILWVGAEPAGDLEDLARRVERATADVPTADARPFVAHATIGRFRSAPDPHELARWLAHGRDLELGEVRVSEAVLFESRIAAPSPVYVALARAPLGGVPR